MPPSFTRGIFTITLEKMVTPYGLKPNGTHFESQRISVRAGRLVLNDD